MATAVGFVKEEGSVVVVREWVVYNGGVLPKTVYVVYYKGGVVKNGAQLAARLEEMSSLMGLFLARGGDVATAVGIVIGQPE